MSFFGKVKQATGIGLDGAGSYNRAFEKGVLMGDQKGAVPMFREAAQKLQRENNTALADQATANALLYEFLAEPNDGRLQPLRDALSRLSSIEQIGAHAEYMPVEPLVRELDLRLVESRIPDTPHEAAIAGHERALALLQQFAGVPLITYRRAQLPRDGTPEDDPSARSDWHQRRIFWHTGMISSVAAQAAMPISPTEAANHAIAAAQAFRRAGDDANRTRADQLVQALQVRRTCWLCHREMQGLGIYIKWYPSNITPYTALALERAGQDLGSIDVQHSQLIACTPCASLVQKQAEAVAVARVEQVKTELLRQISALQTELVELRGKLKS